MIMMGRITKANLRWSRTQVKFCQFHISFSGELVEQKYLVGVDSLTLNVFNHKLGW